MTPNEYIMSDEAVIDDDSVSELKLLDNTNSSDKVIPECHWTETLKWRGSTFNTLPHVQMLADGGTTILRTKTTGKVNSPNGFTKQTFWVRYDRGFVIQWLVKVLLRSFAGIPYNDLQKLLSEAMKEYKFQQSKNAKPTLVKGRSID